MELKIKYGKGDETVFSQLLEVSCEENGGDTKEVFINVTECNEDEELYSFYAVRAWNEETGYEESSPGRITETEFKGKYRNFSEAKKALEKIIEELREIERRKREYRQRNEIIEKEETIVI